MGNMGNTRDGAFNAVVSFFGKLGELIEIIEVFALSGGVFALAVLWIINIIARTFFSSIYFVEEVSQLLVILITFVGLSYGVRNARHIRMGAIFDALSPRPKKVLIFIIAGVSLVLMFMLFNFSLNYTLEAMTMSHRTPALRLPYWIFWGIVPIGFFLAGIQYLLTIIKNISEKEVWLSPQQKSDYEIEIVEGDD